PLLRQHSLPPGPPIVQESKHCLCRLGFQVSIRRRAWPLSTPFGCPGHPPSVRWFPPFSAWFSQARRRVTCPVRRANVPAGSAPEPAGTLALRTVTRRGTMPRKLGNCFHVCGYLTHSIPGTPPKPSTLVFARLCKG